MSRQPTPPGGGRRQCHNHHYHYATPMSSIDVEDTPTNNHNNNHSSGGGGYLSIRAKFYCLVIFALLVNIFHGARDTTRLFNFNNFAVDTKTTIALFQNLLPSSSSAIAHDNLDNNNNTSQSTDVDLPFQPAPYDYYATPIRTKYTLPDPLMNKNNNQRYYNNNNTNKLLVLVLSARANFEQRHAIRVSWGKGYDNLVFVVGGPPPNKEEDDETTTTTSLKLWEEQQRHQDLLDVILPDSYRSLPYKVDYALTWIYNQTQTQSSSSPKEPPSFSFSQLEWVLKVDDDVVVRIQKLQRFLLQQYNPAHPMVIGDILVDTRKAFHGKWAEDPHYTPLYYPPWPRGSAGYVLSRPIVNYIGRRRMTLHHHHRYYYQGEDVSLGIWLEQGHAAFAAAGSREQDDKTTSTTPSTMISDLTWIHVSEFVFESGCTAPHIITGHDMSPETMQQCFWDHGGDTVEPHKSRIHHHDKPVQLFDTDLTDYWGPN
jgi:Galactosyltransferase